MKPTRATFRAAFLAAVLLGACGCEPAHELVWRYRKPQVEKQEGMAPNFRLVLSGWPSPSDPYVTVKVERQTYFVETRKQQRQQFKKFDDGTFEPVPGTLQPKTSVAVTGETAWIPAADMPVSFSVDVAGRASTVQTDGTGKARFDVSPFSEEWVEGHGITVSAKADLQVLEKQDVWQQFKGKHPNELRKAAVSTKPVEERADVSERTLQSIFEKQ